MDTQSTVCEQRTKVRVSISATAMIDSSRYKVENWSLGGLRLSGFKQPVKMGDCLPVQFRCKVDGEAHIEINTLIEAVWIVPLKGLLGARFLNLTQSEMKLLQYSIEDWQPSEITGIESSINPGEILLHAISTDTRPPQSERSPRARLRPKKLVAVLAYVGVGGAVGGLTLSAVAQSINTMEIRSAVVAAQVEPIAVSRLGVLSAVYVQPGVDVKAGQPLFQVSQPDAVDREMGDVNALARNKVDNVDQLTQQIALSRIELAEAQAGLQQAESLKQQERSTLGSYEAIAQSKLNTARSRVQSLTVQHQIAKRKLDRFTVLLQAGAISQQAFDEVGSQFAVQEGDLKAAAEELKIAQTAYMSVQNGIFYDGNDLVGELPRLTIEVKDWQRRTQLVSQKLTTLKQLLHHQQQDVQHLAQQKQTLQQVFSDAKTDQFNLLSVVYRSPFSGSILKVMKSTGNTVSQSEPVMILQQNSEETTVNAYLTQDQADQVAIGSWADVSVPTLNHKYQAQVIEINRTGGFEEPVRGEYQFNGSINQSVYVKLKLVDINPVDQHQLTVGTPVVLQFAKKTTILAALLNRW